jgi:hypothetical protein
MLRRITLFAIAGVVAIACARAALTADYKPSPTITGTTLQWHSGATRNELAAAKIIRIAQDFRAYDLANLRNDQIIETPSGRQMPVSRLRAIQQMFAHARERAAARPSQLKIYPAPSGACSPMREGETLQNILARPSEDVICFHSGRRATVAQIRALQAVAARGFARPYVPDLSASPSSAQAVPVSNAQQMFAQLQHAPDSTVLVNPKGARITVGALRAAIAQEHGRSLYRISAPAGR